MPSQPPVVAVSVCSSRAVPASAGRASLDGGASCTTADGLEVEVSLPRPFVAVTRVRTVWPTSPAVSSYVLPVAPGMTTQLLPAASQRSHS